MLYLIVSLFIIYYYLSFTFLYIFIIFIIFIIYLILFVSLIIFIFNLNNFIVEILKFFYFFIFSINFITFVSNFSILYFYLVVFWSINNRNTVNSLCKYIYKTQNWSSQFDISWKRRIEHWFRPCDQRSCSDMTTKEFT